MEINVLHIEDDPSFAKMAKMSLERVGNGIHLTTATTAEEGIAHLHEDAPECIVCDFDLPGCDGLDVFETVREEHGDIPFILYTGKGSEEIASDAISAGVTDYLQKSGGSDHFELLFNRIENAVKQYRSEQERRETENRYRKLVDHSPNVVAVLQDGVIVYANQRTAEIAGLEDTDELLGEKIDGIYEGRWRDSASLERAVTESGESVEGSITFETVDGDYRYATYRATPITYDGRPAVQMVSKDVTESVARREKLVHEIERSNEVANTLAHDIRNQLATAVGHVDMAVEDGDTSTLPRALDALESIDDIIGDTLSFSRNGRPVSATEVESVSVRDLATRAWMDAGHEDGELVFDEPPIVDAERCRLQRLLENLFRNAVDHVGEDVTVTVGGLSHGDGFYVEDDGPGIPEEDRLEVFERGYTTSDSGTGFGLAIVREIAHSHEWEVSLDDVDRTRFLFDVQSGVRHSADVHVEEVGSAK